MSHSTFSHPVDRSTQNQSLDGRFHVCKVLVNQFCRRIYLAQDLHQPGQPECLIYYLERVSDSTKYQQAIRTLLQREVDLLSELGNHPQIPALLAYFENDKGFYIVQEAIPGTPLKQLLQEGQGWSAERVIQFLQDTLELLSFVQNHGCVHGNLTPNALIQQEDGQLCLVDFGSLLQIQESLIAASGQPVPYSDAAQHGYQPLEQLQGLACPASDVYAVGMMGIQALTGLRPTQLKIDLEAKRVLWRKQYQPKTLVERGLVEILNSMVQWDLTQRYGTAAEALVAVQELASSLSAPSPVLTIAAAPVKEAKASSTLVLSQPVAYPVAGWVPTAETVAERPDYQQESVHVVADSEGPRSPAVYSQPGYQFGPGFIQPPVALPDEKLTPPIKGKRSLFSKLSQPAVLIGAGGTVATLGIAAIGWSLVASGGGTGKENVWERLAKLNTGATSEDGVSSSNTSQEWRKNWQTGADTYRQAEQAFNLGKWLEASKISQRMPPIPYWQDRGKTLSKLAIARAESDSSQLLQSAYGYALDRNFTAALQQLNQIPQESSVAEVAQQKIKEYKNKQVVRAWFDLQRAYERAAVQDFTQALTYLWQIPPGTPAYETAREKIAEYTQKQEQYIRAQTRAATDQAQQGNFQAALLTLEKIPKGTALDPEVAAISTQYTQQLNQQANQQLQQATLQAATGNTTATVAALEKIPMGTEAYAQARDKIAEYTGKQSSAIAQEPVPQQMIAALELNPGVQLREAL